jgi:hypothetical protein
MSLRILSASSLDLDLSFVLPVSFINAPTSISITAQDLIELFDPRILRADTFMLSIDAQQYCSWVFPSKSSGLWDLIGRVSI